MRQRVRIQIVLCSLAMLPIFSWLPCEALAAKKLTFSTSGQGLNQMFVSGNKFKYECYWGSAVGAGDGGLTVVNDDSKVYYFATGPSSFNNVRMFQLPGDRGANAYPKLAEWKPTAATVRACSPAPDGMRRRVQFRATLRLPAQLRCRPPISVRNRHRKNHQAMRMRSHRRYR